jgi:hypothetical protein
MHEENSQRPIDDSFVPCELSRVRYRQVRAEQIGSKDHPRDRSIADTEDSRWHNDVVHVTLPWVRCEHVIPEINTRVTLSHERRERREGEQ